MGCTVLHRCSGAWRTIMHRRIRVLTARSCTVAPFCTVPLTYLLPRPVKEKRGGGKGRSNGADGADGAEGGVS